MRLFEVPEKSKISVKLIANMPPVVLNYYGIDENRAYCENEGGDMIELSVNQEVELV
jgi:hypothetical protein